MQNGELAPRANLRGAIAFGRMAAAVWAFASSRRWLLSAVLATGGLLGVLMLLPPKHLSIADDNDEIETTFDEVKHLNAAPGSAGSWFRRGQGEATADGRAANHVAGLTLGSPPNEDNEPPEAARLTRRLDAVRSRQARGAWLTGSIHAGENTARQSANGPIHPPAQTATQTSNSHNATVSPSPESVFQ